MSPINGHHIDDLLRAATAPAAEPPGGPPGSLFGPLAIGSLAAPGGGDKFALHREAHLASLARETKAHLSGLTEFAASSLAKIAPVVALAEADADAAAALQAAGLQHAALRSFADDLRAVFARLHAPAPPASSES